MDIDAQLKANGMLTVEELMTGKYPMQKFMVSNEVHDLDSFGRWLTRKCLEYQTMNARMTLGLDSYDESERAEMKEYLNTKAAVFLEIFENYKSATEKG